jgi:lipopolysaccharide export LptBFGC system permease protein LptF
MNLSLTDSQDKNIIKKKPKDMTILELKNEVAKLKKEGIDPAPLATEIYAKISLAFSCLVFILLGSSLAIITRRREKTINIGIAVLIIFVYYPLFIGCEALAIQGYIDPEIAMWIPNFIFGAAGALLIYKLCAL